MSSLRLVDALSGLCHELAESRSRDLASLGASLEARLQGPLTVALAGRTKAGKSTLLNALVGERVAPTDTSECTRFVTWYRDGPSYLATLEGEDGSRRPLRFTREAGRAIIDVGGPVFDHSEIVVTLPSRRLRSVHLADTPGFDSADPMLGARTRRLIESGGALLPPRVDAVVYLLRMAHATDTRFLEVFDANGIPGSPLGAVGVLSRADELLDASLTALDQAAEIAAAIARPDVLGGVLGSVIPVSGLLAETAVTLTEPEFACLRTIANADPADTQTSLLSIDRFCTTGTDVIATEVREALAARLGLFGLRWCLSQLALGRVRDSAGMARSLAVVSGLAALRETLDVRFESRAQRLICRSVLGALRAALSELERREPSAARKLEAALERIEAGAHELAELRLLEAVLSGQLMLQPAERAEIERLVEDATIEDRLGHLGDRSALMSEAANRAMVWRGKAQNPLTQPGERALFEVAARSYEGMYSLLANG